MNKIIKMIGAALLAATIIIIPVKAEGLETGCYSVTVVPTYQNPDTGGMEDLGQNPEVGQMMVEAQVQSLGIVEIHEDGNIYLTTRWNLAEPTIYAGFKTSSDGSQSFITRNFDVTKQENIGNYDFAGENFDAVATDFRFKLGSLNDTIRCSNYVEAMGRECVWYCYLTDLREGIEGSWNVVCPEKSVAEEEVIEEEIAEEEIIEEESAAEKKALEEKKNKEKKALEEKKKEEEKALEEKKKEEEKALEEKKKEEKEPAIKERKVASVKKKTTDESIKTGEGLDDSTGIVGLDEKKKPAKKNGKLSLQITIGIIVVAIGVVFYHKKMSKKEDEKDD